MATRIPQGDPKDLVRRSYDRISHAYRGDSVSADEATYLARLRELGFALLWTRFIPASDSGYVLVCVRRPAQ